MQIGCQIGCSKVARALILMILVTFVLNTLQRAPALQGSPQGRLQLGSHSLNIKFLVQIFSIPWLSHLRPPSPLLLRLFSLSDYFFLWDFHNHLFRILVSENTFCDTGWKYSSPLWLLIESIVLGYFPNFTWLLSVVPQWDNTSVWSYLFISQTQGGALSSKHFAVVTQIWKQFELCPVSRGVTRVVSRVTEDAPAL